MCATDHTPLAGTPVLSSQKFVKDWSWIRGGVRLFSFFLAGFAFFLTMLMLSARIDTPEEFVSALWQEKFNAIPLPFAVFLLVLTLPRSRVWMRAVLAIVAGFVLWFFVWQWLVRCDYGAWQGHGIHVIHVDYNHMVYGTDGMTIHWDRQTMGPDTLRGIPMFFGSTFVFAAVSTCVVLALSIRPVRALCNDSDST